MQDEIFDRTYQSGRAELNAGLDRLFAGLARTLGDSFKVLHRIEWGAPWQGAAKPRTWN